MKDIENKLSMTNVLKKIKTNKLNISKRFSAFWQQENLTIADLWEYYSTEYADTKAIIDKYSGLDYSYKEFYEQIKLLASGLQSLGLKKGEHVSLFSENNSKWLLCDQAILFSGAVNAVRGSAAPQSELEYILNHSDSVALFAENLSTILKLENIIEKSKLKFVICLSNEAIPDFIKAKSTIYNLDEIVERGKHFSYEPIAVDNNELATIIYTSGTTGCPKGVMLSHENFISQVKVLKKRIEIEKGSVALSVLPTWHSYERAAEYFILSCGGTIAYTNLINLKNDMKEFKPDNFISVPRIWEAFYNGINQELNKQPLNKRIFIQNCLKISEKYIKFKRTATNRNVLKLNSSALSKLNAFVAANLLYFPHKLADKAVYSKLRLAFGGNLTQGITGGGAIAGHLDDFYEIIGIEVINGYGLTETSPILTANSVETNLRGSVGKPIDNTFIKIVDTETFMPLENNKTGIVMAKGPQVMKGYYKNPEETEKILSKDGWINTGDLGWLTNNGELVLTGRAKDIIVLSNGENVEPQPIEDACLKSPFIDQIMLVGQDKDALGALIIPNEGSIAEWADKNNIKYDNASEIKQIPEINRLFRQILKDCVQSRPNYRTFEKIQHIRLLDEPFTIDNGLMTQTMKLRKNEITTRYASIISDMMK